MDVSGSILANLDAGYPCRHDAVWVFILAGEREIMEHFAAPYSRLSQRELVF